LNAQPDPVDSPLTKMRSGSTSVHKETRPRRSFLNLASPSEAGFSLLEVSLLEVVLQRSVGLGHLVAQRKTDDEVDICRTNMGPRALRELTDQVSRHQATSQIDALSPGPEIAEQSEQRALAARRCCLIVVGAVFSATQNPITSRRR
jgi:hypothetical protein